MTTFNKTYDITTPAGSDDPAEADDRMQEIKAGVQERENVDHYWPLTGTEVSDEDTGEHRKVTLRVGSAPSAVADKGFVYAKDVGSKAELFYIDEDGNEVQLTSKGQNIANDTFLTGTDAAGTGSVNLIKAGTNDLATLPDSAEMASNAAPVEDEAIANKKYVDAHGVVQVVNTQTGAVNTGATTIPFDDTIPQKTEGDEYMTLAITPKSATNKLKIDVVGFWNTSSGTDSEVTAALFQDDISDALAAMSTKSNPTSNVKAYPFVSFTHFMTAGTISEITFKVRAGHKVAGTTTFNGVGGVRILGGVIPSSITITEIKG